ncbi:nuclear mitotic apparatus protein 1 isoform X3 [Zerene cesonia]|uniref:nuclear mitotic apparatus protein 1 isoform X3 n=1 Tax=Zerene cesonia TaxID=33412 RepID=UPI0018E4EEFA|nr:nuclear mitotic apparatus protein 1 isoform X3 [Zerene cesonia]
MDEVHKSLPQNPETKNVLPDVVHSQQITALGSEEKPDIDTGQNRQVSQDISINVESVSEAESVSEQIPSKIEYSLSEANVGHSQSSDLLRPDTNPENVSLRNSPHLAISHSHSISPCALDAKQSTSWNLDIDPSDVHISNESPVNLPVSSDTSKDVPKPNQSKSSMYSEQDEIESPKSDYIDSLNENGSQKSASKSNENPIESATHDQKCETVEKSNSGSEEIIKLDIRGMGAPKFPLESAKIIFGPPPEGAVMMGPTVGPIPIFPILTPQVDTEALEIDEVFHGRIAETEESAVIVEEIFDETDIQKSSDKSLSSEGSEKFEQDVLVEEVTVGCDVREKRDGAQPKSLAPEETMSFSTMTTDYKTICEEYHVKLVQFEEAISQRDHQIEQLKISLQRYQELHNAEHSDDTIKAQLSDFIKYQSMLKDDSTKFFSAVMSGTGSLPSSNGEKDMDREEITVNYSKSDIQSASESDDFQTGFENKVSILLNKFEGYIEDNLRNKLRESLIQVLCDEIGKMRMEYDTDIRDLESQMRQDKQSYSVETRRLRELLSSVKSGNADIDELKKELSSKYEKEMENLRMFFEKKCSDMERRTNSYSEEVWRGRACVSPCSEEEGAGGAGGAGDARRRTRSADLAPALRLETSTPIDFSQKQSTKKLEQQIEELKAEHLAYINELQARHKEEIVSLEEQITHLKAHIQTAENTEANVSLYQQDIDLELEKARRDEAVRRQVLDQLQEQLQVLLSDPDAELSSWPLELVALREKIHGDKSQQEKELSSLRDEAPGGDADKWRQKRNYTFDQNRQLEEVTKERDGLKRVAAALQRAVSQLVAYCASAEDELNRTVLATLLPQLLSNDESLDVESRPGTPAEGNASAVSRHVHFAPDLQGILAALDESGAGWLQQQRDLSADIKRELEHSLRRLRHEARDLLDLAARLALNKQENEVKTLESSSMQITELVDELDSKHARCDNCEIQKKHMEEAMSEWAQRESLLRAELDAAAPLDSERPHTDVIEGYGTGGARTWAESAAGRSPRRLADALARERDDLAQQLEAANRQLRSTRDFVEEQTAEREAERDEFAARLAALRDENARLAARLHANATILAEIRGLRLAHCNCRQHDAHVEQLENQTREMNQIITDLERKKAASDEELKATEEKIILLRDIIANLESQLEQKTNREAEVLEQLEEMKRTIDERDSKMRAVLGELESLRSERNDTSEVACAKCLQEEDKYTEFVEMIKEQARWLEERLLARTQRLERAHEVCSAHASEPSEDLSIREQKAGACTPARTPRVERCEALARVWGGVDALQRAEDALLKRLADLELQRAALAASAQEVRAERDVLQARMSEQALRVSSLAARLQRQRNDAHALAHCAASELGVRLHDATAEVQRLKEELESKDKHLARLKQIAEEKEKLSDQHATLYGNTCNPKDKVVILERELCAAQARIAQLEGGAAELRRRLRQRDLQLDQIMALKLEDEQNQKSEVIEAKTSGRTLSDIVSISEYDEQDLQMRRAELKTHNSSLTDAPYDTRDKTLNKTLPPDVQRPNMSSLNIDYVDNTDGYTPRAESLPANFTPAQNSNKFKRNVNETTIFGTVEKFGESVKHSTAQNIQDNCSMYPNQNVSDSNNISVEPKKINFSLEPSENKTHLDFTSLQELGIALDMKQENFPDILSQLKHEIKKSRTELENCKEELKHAEEQLCEFPALKEEVEELKGLLENTMATMEKDKKFYESQLENFSSNKNLLEEKLAVLTQEVNEKTKDLNLLKEDILRRETMILELAKEKRNLTGKITELEARINDLHNRNTNLEKHELENKQLRDKVTELQKLEQLVSEKNQQIDSLNQHLDRLDDLQRRLNDKTEEADNLKEALEEKSNELFQMQDSVVALNRDITKVVEENDQLSSNNKELKLRLSKVEKEQENASLKLQNSESERERLNSLNSELTAKIEELKVLTDQLKDKEAEIEILHEDINSYHSEIASLKEQLKMVSRSPSPRNKSGEERKPDRQAGDDRKQLIKIKKQISLLQHELDFNKKELNDKAFELAKAKLDVTELKNNLSQAAKRSVDAEQNVSELQERNQQFQRQVQLLREEKQQLAERLEQLVARLREEGNISELKQKLKDKAERCSELEVELSSMRELVERLRGAGAGAEGGGRARAVRSPTAELERALRVQLQASRSLDDDIMERILSASSDDQEEIPRLALDSSKTSSIHSTSSDRYQRARADAERLQLQLEHLEARLRDKDALISELNRIRDKLTAECEALRLREEAESDNSARLQLLLDAQHHTAAALQKQDTSMISILKRRLESAMQTEQELREREQHLLASLAQHDAHPPPETETVSRLKSEILVLKSRVESERARGDELRREAERHERAAARATRHERAADLLAAQLRAELADLRRLKHEAGVELVRARELLSIQSDTIHQLEDRLAHAIRYLQGRCLRLESWRKALVWQKHYLQRVLAGYREAERRLLPAPPQPPLSGRHRFRCIVNVVRTVIRMGYLVRRRQQVRASAAACLLPGTPASQRDPLGTPADRREACGAPGRREQREQLTPLARGLTPATPQASTPLPRAPARLGSTLARRLLKQDPAVTLPPDYLDDSHRSPYSSSPREQRFILSSPRGEAASAYLSKLEAVSRCLGRTLDDKDNP